MEEFRVARISGTSVNVGFRIDPDEVDDFTTGSGLRLEPRARVIIHASPLWPLNPQGALSGGSDTYDGIRRDVEVVSSDGPSTVRISLRTG